MSSKYFKDKALQDTIEIIDDELKGLEQQSVDNGDRYLDEITTFINSWRVLKKTMEEGL